MLRLAFRTDSLADTGDTLPDSSSFRVHVHMEQPKVHFTPCPPQLPFIPPRELVIHIKWAPLLSTAVV